MRKDGSRFWASVVINAIKDADGSILGFAKITRDLTERRAADERARQAQKMEGIGQLTGGVAHDFNNLLTIIIGNLETLQRNLAMPRLDVERLQRSADNAMRGARRAESLTQRLLAFSRQQPLDPKPIDLGRLITGHVRSCCAARSASRSRSRRCWAAGCGGLLPIPTSSNSPSSIWPSMRAMRCPNGGKLTIETANVYLDEKYAATQIEVVPGQYVMLAVTDNGCGMTPEVKAKAFDPFFTTKDVGHGTGLGLSQVYGFVKQSRGHVKIYSELGEGTTIKLYLPRAHAVADESREHEQDSWLARGARTKRFWSSKMMRMCAAYSCDTLRELGYTVLSAENGAPALRILEQHPDIRVLFTDVGLPGGMNGRQLAEEARKRRPDLKVLFTTAMRATPSSMMAGSIRASNLLTKPFTRRRSPKSCATSSMQDARPGRIFWSRTKR